MEKNEKKSFLSRLLSRRSKTKTDGKRLYSNTKQTTTKIKLALLDLLNTKQLSQINITSLVKVAGVYRATFYLHYKSLNDVVKDIESDVIDSYETLEESMKDIDLYNNIDILINKVNEYIKIDKKYLRIIINTNCFNGITIMLKQLLCDVISNNFIKFGHEVDDKLMLTLSAFTGGLVFIYRDWISGLDIEFDEVEQYIKDFTKRLL